MTDVLPKRKKQRGMQFLAPTSNYKIQFNDIVIFILEKKMGVTRRMFLMDLARRKGFRIENELRYGMSGENHALCFLFCCAEMKLESFLVEC